jgi:hypothetical protein
MSVAFSRAPLRAAKAFNPESDELLPQPFGSLRGVRLLLRYPDLLDTQFNALLEFSRGYDVRILVPMVTLAEDMAQMDADSANWPMPQVSVILRLSER